MRKLTCGLSAFVILFAAPAYAAPLDIGSAAIIKNTVTGSIDARTRVIKHGDRVHQNEAIVTGKEAGAQLLFRDETALTMGANSTIVLDTFIYDPEKRLGKLSIRAVTGAFRFVSGSAPKNAYEIKTPMGTLGVRGTIVQFWLTQNDLRVQLDEGAALFCNVQRCVELTKPGTYVVVTRQQIGETRSTQGSPSQGNAYVPDKNDPLQSQFLDTKKFNPPPPPSQFRPDGTRR